MHKNISSILIALLFIFGIFSLGLCDDSVTITTYYPSPYGSYKELQLFPSPGEITPCNADSKGTMYYNSIEKVIKICDGNNYVAITGYWAGSGNNIYNTNTGMVGIGTNNFQTKLNVGGDITVCKNDFCCPIYKDCDGDGVTYGGGDCDERCPSCYLGAPGTGSADGKDQNCNGVVDELYSPSATKRCSGSQTVAKFWLDPQCAGYCSSKGMGFHKLTINKCKEVEYNFPGGPCINPVDLVNFGACTTFTVPTCGGKITMCLNGFDVTCDCSSPKVYF